VVFQAPGGMLEAVLSVSAVVPVRRLEEIGAVDQRLTASIRGVASLPLPSPLAPFPSRSIPSKAGARRAPALDAFRRPFPRRGSLIGILAKRDLSYQL
jgi:hypothetical protein